MNNKRLKRGVYCFWGAMDLCVAAVLLYGIISLMIYIGISGAIESAVMMFTLAVTHADTWVFLKVFVGPLLLSGSILLTTYLLFAQHRYAWLLALLQTPFRVYLTLSSLVFLSWLTGSVGLNESRFVWVIFLGVEVLKLYSLKWVDQRMRREIEMKAS